MDEVLHIRIPRTPRLVLIDTQSDPMRLATYIGLRRIADFSVSEPIGPEEVEFARMYDPKNPKREEIEE